VDSYIPLAKQTRKEFCCWILTMRLINTRTLEVVSKGDDEIPPYAILSHTWGRDEEEVTLHDMQALFAAAEADPTVFSTHPFV
jgi:hypothetical protein